MPTLNERAWKLCDAMSAEAGELGIDVSVSDCGTRIIDCGVKAVGSIEAGRKLAEICTAGMASIELVKLDSSLWTEEAVGIATQQPIAACMASQYAGWQITGEKYFAMGSGPMRAAAGREAIFDEINHRERPEVCVGVLETNKIPKDAVCIELATKCGVAPHRLSLLTARTSSIAGTTQIVARSLETALHKLHTLGFDLSRVDRGRGTAPLPPVGVDDLTAIGWTNDAILYGGYAHLLVYGDDESLQEFGPKVPSNASPDYGRPFSEIFQRYQGDFYKIDPMLFSPAAITLENRDTGSRFDFGEFAPNLLAESFAKK